MTLEFPMGLYSNTILWDFQGLSSSFVLSGISKGKLTNLTIPGVFFKKACLNPPPPSSPPYFSKYVLNCVGNPHCLIFNFWLLIFLFHGQVPYLISSSYNIKLNFDHIWLGLSVRKVPVFRIYCKHIIHNIISSESRLGIYMLQSL